MEAQEKKLKTLEQIMELLDSDFVKPDEMIQVMEEMMKVISDLKDKMTQEMANDRGEMTDKHNEMYQEMNAMEERMKSICDKMDKKMGGDKKEVMEQVMKEVNKCIDMMPQMPDLRPLMDRIKEIEAKIPKIPDEITPIQVRDKLENIDNESEKLDIDAIKNLRKELDNMKKGIERRPIFGGGGFSKIAMESKFIDDETPVGTVNGVNTTFTIRHAPNPSASVKVFVNGQRMRITEDYTFSGQTITFLIAPPTTSILLVDYRI